MNNVDWNRKVLYVKQAENLHRENCNGDSNCSRCENLKTSIQELIQEAPRYIIVLTTVMMYIVHPIITFKAFKAVKCEHTP